MERGLDDDDDDDLHLSFYSRPCLGEKTDALFQRSTSSYRKFLLFGTFCQEGGPEVEGIIDK